MPKQLLSIILMISGIAVVFLLFTDTSSMLKLANYQRTPVTPTGQPVLSPSVPTSPAPEPTWEGYETRKVTIEGVEYNLLVADTYEKQARGLMDVTDLGPYDGMIFTMQQSGVQTFWNQNTLMELDVLWMNGDTVVGRSILPPITESGEVVMVTSPEAVNVVVELPRKK